MINLIVAVFLMTLLGAGGGFFLKKSANITPWQLQFKKPWLYGGAVLYLFSFIFNIYLLQMMPYSTVLPLTSLTYVWTAIIAYFLLYEGMSLLKVIGIALIIVGGLLVSI